MKKLLKVLSVSLCATLVAGAVWAAPKFKTEQEKQSYAIGANLARKLKEQGVTFDASALAKGVKDELGGKSRLTDAEIDETLKQLQNEVRERKVAEHKKLAAENKARGLAFLAENAKKEGVTTLPGGVQYKVLQAGTGEKPTEADSIHCHYRGMLVDGTVFDSSPPGKPAYFDVYEVIPGWREALEQMPVGSKWEIMIPAEKAYGERGAAPAIGPNETLIFEVELLGIN
jgi:FKBP-type peptidyl-prolyl cis-trans isomerase FklB